ncbi:MAG: 5-formyltetrahydrofolate cyclo-ligase [Flammeovirgaceae bacterium]|nr:MAG: 5-formyltetrahydrofolate cyclo-ligase [Flammeovirgaceae bacterium]
MTKQELRDSFIKKRLSLNEAEYYLFNRRLCDMFFASVDLSFVKVIHCFLPIIKKKEPDTWLIIDRLQREFTHIRLAVPKVNPATNQLEHFLFEGMRNLKTSRWGVPEPTGNIVMPADKIDLVLVPLLAFDTTGHRVGYGKGYYDRFLAKCRPQTNRIGISFFGPVDSIDTTTDDIPLTGCITPEKFFRFTS